MKRNASNMDGFVIRAQVGRRATLDEMPDNIRDPEDLQSLPRPSQSLAEFINKKPSKPKKVSQNSRDPEDLTDDLASSLADLPGYDNLNSDQLLEGEPMEDKKLKKVLKKASRPPKNKKSKKPKSKKKTVLIILAVIVVLLGALFGLSKWLWPEDTFQGDWWDIFGDQRLQEDAEGRTNILIFGVAPEDYDGPLLADTILVLSINQTTKAAYMVSLPRDLWVKHNCPNPALGTTAGRLNETYRCALNEAETNDVEAANEFRGKAGEITGLDIQYYINLSWQGVEDAVDKLGGIDITIESNDPRGIYDVNTGLKFANGEQVHMDGQTALRFARARGADGGYGLEGSNFSRELHQQQIIKALQAKATASGVLANPATVVDLVKTLGSNVKTNFEAGEIRSLGNLAKEIDTDSIVSLPLLDEEKGVSLVKNANINGASVVVPTVGTFDYSEIHDYIKLGTSSDPVIREGALIDVLNGSGVEGLATKKADQLKSNNFRVGVIGNAQAGEYAAVQIYQLSSDKPATAEALKKLFQVEIKTVLPYNYATDADFVLIFGAE